MNGKGRASVALFDIEGSSSGAPASRAVALVDVCHGSCPVTLAPLLRLTVLDSLVVRRTSGQDGSVESLARPLVALHRRC